MPRRRIMLFVILALLATWAGAWVPAYFDQTGPATAYTEPVRWQQARAIGLLGTTLWQFEIALGAPPPLPGTPGSLRASLHRTTMVSRAPPMVTYSPESAFTSFLAWEWGFPFRCFWSWMQEDRTSIATGMASTVTTGGGIAMSADTALPYLPIWFGLIANALFHFTAFIGLHTGVRAWHRSHRRRRGLCPHCAYDLRGTPIENPCPECGRVQHAAV